jgi:hypothetical protein
VQPRVVSLQQARRLELLRRVARLAVPGTSFRVGLDPVLGLVPGLGDVLPPLFAIAVLWHAYLLRVPRVVQLRMVFNVMLDALVGLVPVVGDLFDVAWRANDRNMALLERHAYEDRPPSTGDVVFVGAVALLLVALAAAPVLLAGWLLSLFWN